MCLVTSRCTLSPWPHRIFYTESCRLRPAASSSHILFGELLPVLAAEPGLQG